MTIGNANVSIVTWIVVESTGINRGQHLGSIAISRGGPCVNVGQSTAVTITLYGKIDSSY